VAIGDEVRRDGSKACQFAGVFDRSPGKPATVAVVVGTKELQ
jgi:hypothetical protein